MSPNDFWVLERHWTAAGLSRVEGPIIASGYSVVRAETCYGGRRGSLQQRTLWRVPLIITSSKCSCKSRLSGTRKGGRIFDGRQLGLFIGCNLSRRYRRTARLVT